MTERAPATERPAAPREGAGSRRNPYTVALSAVGGFAWVLAFILWNVLIQVTDYATYDVEEASALTTWIDTLLVSGAVAIVGALVVAGVGRELRRISRD